MTWKSIHQDKNRQFMEFHIDEIWIDQDAFHEPLTERIRARLPRAKVLVGSAISPAARALALEGDPLDSGKRILRLMKHKGSLVKPCPGTPEYVCCGLQILHIGQGCPMDCRYCALQVYFNRPVLEVFVNVDELLGQIRQRLTTQPRQFHRFCTGEFTDSLALDPLTGLTERLIAFFSTTQNASLEIKTKTDLIEPLLRQSPKGRVILSFSVNSLPITRKEEIRAAPLERRLAAAAAVQDRGYRVGFHFDPIIPHADWEDAYTQTIDAIFRTVSPRAIAWISLGVLRFVPELKETATARFGPIPYFHDGFVRGLDGKSRLHVDGRITIYRVLARRIREKSSEIPVYLCMESPHVWQQSLGMRMENSEQLTAYLDGAIL